MRVNGINNSANLSFKSLKISLTNKGKYSQINANFLKRFLKNEKEIGTRISDKSDTLITRAGAYVELSLQNQLQTFFFPCKRAKHESFNKYAKRMISIVDDGIKDLYIRNKVQLTSKHFYCP